MKIYACGIPDELKEFASPRTFETKFFRKCGQILSLKKWFSPLQAQRHVVPRHPDFMITIIDIFSFRFVRAFAGLKNNSHGIKVKIEFNVRSLLCALHRMSSFTIEINLL